MPWLALATALTLEPWDLVRVDVPDHPEADASSDHGSMLLAPPSDGTPWRVASVPELDDTEAFEALDALDVAPWHAAGVDGSGVSVAVFDLQWYGAELRDLGILDELSPAGTWDCYAHRSCGVPMDTLRPRFSWEEGAHGVACAEIIRDIAPGVELHLVRVNGQTSLENAIAWAQREGIDLISMSLSFFNESFYDGTGAISDLMDELDAVDTLMVTSAGNYALEHHVARFSDADLDGRHDFGVDSPYLPVWMEAGTRRVSLNWDEYFACGNTDLDLYVYAQDGDLVGRSTIRQLPEDGCRPVERARISVAEDGWHYLVVHRAGGPAATDFRIFARGSELWEPMPQGSVTDPGTHPAVLTVGAVRGRNYLDNGAESFSSAGPTWSGVAKPELAGPDGLTTTVYGPTGFFGTSAATPAVVGALALLMSEDPSLRPQDAARKLIDASLSSRPLWVADDPALGAGHARLPPPGTTPRGCAASTIFALLILPLGAMKRRGEDTARRSKEAEPPLPR